MDLTAILLVVAHTPELVDRWRALDARHAAISEAVERELQRRHRLSRSELEALQRMAENGEDGCRLQHLLDDVHMSQSALSRLVARLEERGLVERRACADDRRGIFAVLTPAGRARLAEATPTQLEVLERLLGD
jgi:DNA-binding MarR family transcriptional regulator